MARIQCNMISYSLMRTVDINIILPTVTIPQIFADKDNVNHIVKEKYPVLYLLHGYGNNQAQWCGYTNVELFAEERKIAVVMISAENKNYINYGNDLFEDFLTKELPEFIVNNFPISSRKEDTYIAGLSMGGFGALYHGLGKPDQYQAVGAFSPAIKMEANPADLYKKVEETDKLQKNIFITCGENDFVYDMDIEFLEFLKEKKYEFTWISEPDYKHEWRFWNLSIERFLDWIPRTDYYAKERVEV